MEILPHEKHLAEYERTLRQLRDQNQTEQLVSEKELSKLELRLDRLKKKIYKKLSPWDRVQICRHPKRPKSLDCIQNLCASFFELCGDRTFGDDHAVVGGLGHIDGERWMVIGQEKGADTDSRLYRNFGMLSPEGFRKARRLAEMAGKFHIPILFLLDTPGAYPGLTAEERGQGWAIAENLRELFRIPTPIVVLVIGEGCSGGALGMGIGDEIAMLEHAYYSVISPEGCASILWKDAEKKEKAAETLKMQAEDLLRLGVIDHIIPEPMGGAHYDPPLLFQTIKQYLRACHERWHAASGAELRMHRYAKFRRMGCFEESRESSC